STFPTRRSSDLCRTGLVAELREFLDVHGPVSRRWDLNKMPEKPRDVKAGQPRLRDGVSFEFCNLFAGPLVTKLFGYARAVRAFCFFKCVFAQRCRKPINFYAC